MTPRAAPQPPAEKPRNRGGHPRIDWDEALRFYLELGPTRAYGAVSRRFGISDTGVGQHARKNAWKRRAIEYDEAVWAKLHEQSVLTRAQRVAKSLRVVDSLLGRYEAEAAALDLKVADLPGIVKLAELLEGEATDRINVGEVQGVIRTVFLVAGRFVPADRRDDFLAELEQATVGLAERTALPDAAVAA